MAGIGAEDTSKSMDGCIKQKPGIGKDMCIFMVVSVHANQTQGLDKNLCDANIENNEIRDICNAILKKDKSYCYNITSSDSRVKCFGLVEEINGKVKV